MIVFDLTLATRRPELTGIERFGINLFRAMRERAADTIAYVSDPALVGGPNLVLAGAAQSAWLGLPLRAPRGKGVTFVMPSYPASPLFLLRGGRIVRIVHDDFPWTRAAEIPGRARFLFRDLETAMMRRYAAVATPAASTAEALAARFRRPVATVGNGPGVRIGGMAKPVVSLEGRRFVLLVGTIEPRKNYDALLALAASRAAADLTFVVAGRPGWGDVVGRLRSASNDALIWIENAADAEMAWLYANCSAFLSLSHAEGFNMPLVEAGIAGCQIVCSDLPIHRSVAPEDSVFIDAGASLAEVAAMIRQAAARPRVDRPAYRARFSWDEVARNVSALACG
jgi:glycosyltransferase involved in cell wall biosynthesis